MGCVQALPVWESLDRRFQSRARILGVVATGAAPVDELKARAQDLGARNPTYYDLDGATRGAWGVSGHPTILVVDDAGVVVREVDWIAMVTGDEEGEPPEVWRKRLEAELAEEIDVLLR